ncbi:MAG: transaldolase family protein [Chloroflexia bacterium]
MALYLDSAQVEEVRQAIAWGFVTGVTTNPKLMAQAGRPAEEVVSEICRLCPGPVFYQPVATEPFALEEEGRHFSALSPAQIVLKIPASLENFAILARLAPEIPCAATAVFSPGQAYLAAEAGARYVIPYVNRMTRYSGRGIALVAEIAEVLRATGRRTELLAASLREVDEVLACLSAGAHHVTLPFTLIREMAAHPLSEQAIAEFAHYQDRPPR